MDTFRRAVNLAGNAGATVLSDEVYRLLEHNLTDRLPAAADLHEGAVSLGVMSKSFGLAGLRIGWLATRDLDLLGRVAAFKDYTTICNSAPSEVLALIALRAREEVLGRNLGIVLGNLPLADAFFEKWRGVFEWVRPRVGCIGFPRLLSGAPAEVFAAELVEEEGVMLVPGSVYGQPLPPRLRPAQLPGGAWAPRPLRGRAAGLICPGYSNLAEKPRASASLLWC